MKKTKLLPKLALKGVIQNGTVYFPYVIACIFSVFTFFVFSSIVANDIVKTLPHSSYAVVLLILGKVLLGIILVPFLFYTNSFLIKRRKKEIGLYSLLGLEKKHIGIMLLLETVIIYVISIAGGVIFGMVLSKLLFLLLLKLSGLPVVAEFVFNPSSFTETMIFFAVVFVLNYIYSLRQLQKSKPVELLSGSKKGEKEPKRIVPLAILGFVTIGVGYTMAILSKLDSTIFTNFFFAVLLVVIGTYFLFTSGSIFFLRILKRNKKIYYNSSNFITISGMLYRMKKNAASLSNICIFSTMVLITLTCTLALFFGKEEIAYYDHPYDVKLYFEENSCDTAAIQEKYNALANQYNLKIEKEDSYDIINVTCGKKEHENKFQKKLTGELNKFNYRVMFMTLEDYNKLKDDQETLGEGEVLIYSSGKDFGYETMNFMGREAMVKKEIDVLYPWPKAEKNVFLTEYLIVVKDKEERNEFLKTWAGASGVADQKEDLNSGFHVNAFLLEGEDDSKKNFIKDLITWSEGQKGYSLNEDGVEGREMVISMEGGLLFIGIIFGMVFFMCLLLIMYYKQISEGYEDKESFAIMQKVGLSEREIKSTVQKQILMVFFIPLAASYIHTIAGMFMVDCLMGALRFFNTWLIIRCTIAVAAVFLILYGISYLMTAKTYYKIVR